MKASLITLLAAALLGAGIVQAQNEYAEIARLRGMNQTVRGIRSMADGEHYTTLEGSNIIRHSYAAAGPGERMLPSSAANLTITDYSFSPDERQILIASGSKPIYRHSYTTSYFLAAGNSLTPVLREAEAPRDASFSPDSRLIAYSDRNDLYVYDTAARQTRRITDDGAWNSVINGTTDWVYEEEFGFTKAYAFSPDSRRIAYLRFDESQVPLMEMMRFDGKLYNQAYSFKYPKAGERNSTVEVWVCDLATGAKERIDTGRETDQYIPRIGWTPDGRLYFFRLNRRQNTFEMIVCEPHGAQRTVYEERAQQYVERVDDGTVTFVDRDRFLVRQESHTGFMHLYLYSLRRGILEQGTKGPWEVTQVVGTDGRRVWFLSTETSPLRRNLYSVRLDGKDKQRLTTGEGFYTNEELAELTASFAGSGSIFAETPVGFDKVYWFPEGNFCVSWYYELPGGEWVTCYGCNSRYDVLTNSREVGTAALVDSASFKARSHTAPDGTELTILSNGQEAYIYAWLENSFFAERVYPPDDAELTDEALDEIADTLIYSRIGK